jgi:hypothetical protein
MMGVLITIAIRLLEFMFALGVIGSAIVMVLSGVEDIETLIGPDDSNHH